MKNIVLFIMFLLSTIVGTAKTIEIPVQQFSVSSEGKRNNQKGSIRHAPPARTKLPNVTLEGNTITINSFSNGATISLALYDEDVKVIYDITSTATTSIWSFYIPNDLMDNAASLQLVINGKMYIGEF